MAKLYQKKEKKSLKNFKPISILKNIFLLIFGKNRLRFQKCNFLKHIKVQTAKQLTFKGSDGDTASSIIEQLCLSYVF